MRLRSVVGRPGEASIDVARTGRISYHARHIQCLNEIETTGLNLVADVVELVDTLS